MADNDGVKFAPVEGRFGVLIPGMGEMATTLIAERVGVNFLCRDLARRAGMRGVQEWLSYYLQNTLRCMRGEGLLTHLGLEYYD